MRQRDRAGEDRLADSREVLDEHVAPREEVAATSSITSRLPRMTFSTLSISRVKTGRPPPEAPLPRPPAPAGGRRCGLSFGAHRPSCPAAAGSRRNGTGSRGRDGVRPRSRRGATFGRAGRRGDDRPRRPEPFGSRQPPPAPLGWTHERARPQHRQLLPQVPGHRHRPRGHREEPGPPARPRRDRADRQRVARHLPRRGQARRAPHRRAARPPRGARLPPALAGLARGRGARASPPSATSTRSATAACTAARSSRARS